MGRSRAPLSPQLRQLDGRMRSVAGEQGGVVTAGQCRALGGDDGAIRSLLAAGPWRRERRGIYRDLRLCLPEGVDVAFVGRCAALLAGLRGPAVISHDSAARLLGLPLPPGGAGRRIRVTRRPPAPTNDPLLGDVHVTGYSDADVVDLHGVPVLGGARLVLDCCSVMSPDSALAVADAMLLRGLTDDDALVDALDACRSPPAWAAQVIDRADPGGTNWFESSSRWWLLEEGLPRPRLQVPFAADGRRADVDLWFPGQRTVGEADGAGKYDEPGALFAEKQREDWLRDRFAVEVVRWVPAEMRSPVGREGVAERFRRAFRRRC